MPRSESPHADELAALAAQIRAARRRYGLTQTALAGLAGTGLRFISELERGKPTVSLDKLLAVVATLGLRLELRDVAGAVDGP